jgi:hypothetical protein
MTPRKPAPPKAKHTDTIIHFALTNAPDQVTKGGLPFIADRMSLHIGPLNQWVWVEGRGVRKDGSISEQPQMRRGCGYDLTPPVGRSQRHVPEWVLAVLAGATFPKVAQ